MGFKEVAHLVERKEEEVRPVAGGPIFTSLRRKYFQTGVLL